ncbi:unnamed protein product [Adineta steineri]|uniref:Pentapeptide repeat-containing protein n=1 Tax=Adineta steineri TaxID=433720 RepID=A0A819TQG5_9BILA|nr:unnamed protein product [Adineta steineri]
MALRDQSTMTDQTKSMPSRFCGVSLQALLTLIGSFILPLMLGVFTVIITLHQQHVGVQQRMEDRKIARELREQDLNISREQRLHDLNMLGLQREQDLNISREQRTQDKEIAEERLRDAVLVAYLNDIANLLKDNDGILTRNPTVAIIARAKTLTAIRQLDSSRNSYLIQFLYEAKQLFSDANPLDLSNAELNAVDFNINKNVHQNFRKLSLAGALLRNSSFYFSDLSYANFSKADLTGAKFEKTILNNADMSNSTIVRADFSGSQLSKSNFTYTQSRLSIFTNAHALYANFTQSNMEAVDFSRCNCRDVDFTEATMVRGIFHTAHLDRSRFIASIVPRANFYNARLIGSNLSNARLQSTNFSKSICDGAIFSKVDLINASFLQAKIKDLDLSNLNLQNIDFSGADLTFTTLSRSTLDNVKFNGTITFLTNFSFTTMKKAFISDEQLSNALTIQGAKLPNGTVFQHDPNLLSNGYANCSHKLLNSNWKVFPLGAIIISPKNISSHECIFMNQMNSSSSMSQNITLIKHKTLTLARRAILIVTVRSGVGKIASIRLDDHANKLISMRNFTKESDIFTLQGQSVTFQPKVTVEFFGYGWCHSIELTVAMTPRIP